MKQQKVIQQSKISIILDAYDDIFSDFDPRYYSERSLSDDFMNEARKVCRGRDDEKLTLQLMIPAKLRDIKHEEIIAKRLNRHFEKHHSIIENDIRQIRKRGLLFILCGTVLMSLATLLSIKAGKNYMLNMLRVLVEPGGWFCMWNGFDRIILEPNQKKPELSFADHMARCQIAFIPY